MSNILPENFGRDHWSTFAYIETRCVDYGGVPLRQQMRIDGIKYPTRLREGIAINHNDSDCADDLEDAGLLVNNGTGFNQIFRLTPLGWQVASLLRQHKAAGNSFNSFLWIPDNPVRKTDEENPNA